MPERITDRLASARLNAARASSGAMDCIPPEKLDDEERREFSQALATSAETLAREGGIEPEDEEISFADSFAATLRAMEEDLPDEARACADVASPMDEIVNYEL